MECVHFRTHWSQVTWRSDRFYSYQVLLWCELRFGVTLRTGWWGGVGQGQLGWWNLKSYYLSGWSFVGGVGKYFVGEDAKLLVRMGLQGQTYQTLGRGLYYDSSIDMNSSALSMASVMWLSLSWASIKAFLRYANPLLLAVTNSSNFFSLSSSPSNSDVWRAKLDLNCSKEASKVSASVGRILVLGVGGCTALICCPPHSSQRAVSW